MTKETIRKNSISEIKLMMMGRGYTWLSKESEVMDDLTNTPICALTWKNGTLCYTCAGGTIVGIGILCTDELVTLRKELYLTISKISA